MSENKYANWYDEPKTAANLNLVLMGRLYVEHGGHIYEYEGIQEDDRTDKIHILLAEINTGDSLYTSWYEILYSPAFSIKRKEDKPW